VTISLSNVFILDLKPRISPSSLVFSAIIERRATSFGDLAGLGGRCRGDALGSTKIYNKNNNHSKLCN
jgi:hypothetical protein